MPRCPEPAAPGTVGLPYKGVESRIDPNTGEIQMRCALMMGYYKDPEQTAATMSDDGWLKTGDKGHVEKDGGLRITGRVETSSRQKRGKYVAPAPIEPAGYAPRYRGLRCDRCQLCATAGHYIMLSLDAAARVHSPEQRSALTASLTEHLYSVNARLKPRGNWTASPP